MRVEHGDNSAINTISYIIMTYKTWSEFKAELIELVQHNADSDDQLAMYVYVFLLTQSKNVPKDPEKSLQYLQLAA